MINRFEKFLYYIAEIDHCWHGIAAAEMERYGLKGPYAVYFTALSKKQDGMTNSKEEQRLALELALH